MDVNWPRAAVSKLQTPASAGGASKHAQVVNKRFPPKRRLVQSIVRRRTHTNTPETGLFVHALTVTSSACFKHDLINWSLTRCSASLYLDERTVRIGLGWEQKRTLVERDQVCVPRWGYRFRRAKASVSQGNCRSSSRLASCTVCGTRWRSGAAPGLVGLDSSFLRRTLRP